MSALAALVAAASAWMVVVTAGRGMVLECVLWSLAGGLIAAALLAGR